MAKEKAKGTGIILKPSEITKDNVPYLVSKVKEQIKELKKGTSDEPSTNGDLEGFGKLADIKDPSRLIQAYSMVVGKSAHYEMVSKDFVSMDPSGKVPVLKISGYSADSWKKDILKAYNKLTFGEKLEKLEKALKFLEGHLSADQKFKNDMVGFFDLFGIDAGDSIVTDEVTA